jgi:hypothetical protein
MAKTTIVIDRRNQTIVSESIDGSYTSSLYYVELNGVYVDESDQHERKQSDSVEAVIPRDELKSLTTIKKLLFNLSREDFLDLELDFSSFNIT